MKKSVDEIVTLVSLRFPTFGGGRTSEYNPIVNAMKNSPPAFAAMVDVKEVVKYVRRLSR